MLVLYSCKNFLKKCKLLKPEKQFDLLLTYADFLMLYPGQDILIFFDITSWTRR